MTIDLSQFYGSENIYHHLFGITYTDGIKYLAEQAGAYWLIDAIASHQPSARKSRRLREFQLWELKVDLAKKTAVLTCKEDSDTPELIKQEIEFTDFPISEIKLYLVDQTLMLPSEY